MNQSLSKKNGDSPTRKKSLPSKRLRKASNKSGSAASLRNSVPLSGVSLTALRTKIDRLDDEILSLLNKRANLVLRIKLLKDTEGRAIFDPSREKEIIDQLQRLNRGPLSSDDVATLFQGIVHFFRSWQSSSKKGRQKSR